MKKNQDFFMLFVLRVMNIFKIQRNGSKYLSWHSQVGHDQTFTFFKNGSEGFL